MDNLQVSKIDDKNASLSKYLMKHSNILILKTYTNKISIYQLKFYVATRTAFKIGKQTSPFSAKIIPITTVTATTPANNIILICCIFKLIIYS